MAAAATRPLPAWRWAALLGFALVAPVSLPAGGGERRQPELRRRVAGEPLLSQAPSTLCAAPSRCAPVLASVMRDQPMRVLRSWQGSSEEHWLLVEAPGGSEPSRRRRGWMLLETSA
jgi:hypothetical protein